MGQKTPPNKNFLFYNTALINGAGHGDTLVHFCVMRNRFAVGAITAALNLFIDISSNYLSPVADVYVPQPRMSVEIGFALGITENHQVAIVILHSIDIGDVELCHKHSYR